MKRGEKLSERLTGLFFIITCFVVTVLRSFLCENLFCLFVCFRNSRKFFLMARHLFFERRGEGEGGREKKSTYAPENTSGKFLSRVSIQGAGGKEIFISASECTRQRRERREREREESKKR